MKKQAPMSKEPLQLLSVVIPARNEEGRIAATVEHLHVELRVHHIAHEIVVVDDGSTDDTWGMLREAASRVPTLRPVQNTGGNGFGRAITFGIDHSQGDGVVILMADESDDCRDLVRYWELLNQGPGTLWARDAGSQCKHNCNRQCIADGGINPHVVLRSSASGAQGQIHQTYCGPCGTVGRVCAGPCALRLCKRVMSRRERSWFRPFLPHEDGDRLGARNDTVDY